MGKKSFLTIILAVLAVSGLVIAGVYAYYGRPAEPGAADKESGLIGGQKDEHGCLVAAGYSWCEAKEKCLRTWEDPCVRESAEASEADIESIRQAFAAKYGESAGEIQVTINQFDGVHARGGVKFAMEGGFGPGGIFFAYEENGAWKIAFDGNGLYDCAEIARFGFPSDMTPDCADRESGARDSAEIPNPASAYCASEGGETEIRTDVDGAQSGICKFTDGSECDEWAFFRGECQSGN
ncbi:MAG: DUF333 domain-containing protein [Candidatus Falkowbacteria bacterium]